MKRIPKNVIYIVLGLLVIGAFLYFSTTTPQKPAQVSLSKVIDQANQGQVESIELTGDQLVINLKDGSKEQAFKESNTSLKDYGIDYNKVKVEPKNPNDGSGKWIDIALAFIPVLLIIGFFYFIMRQAQGSNNQAMSFGKSKARVFGMEKEKVKFADVAGAIEAKTELQEIVEFLKYPGKFEALGAKIPKGVLLFGSPGTGKTLLARAVAGEADVPFFSISGSEFVEMFVGVGASRVRDLFNKAKKNAPCIIFIDEIDAVGRQRGTGLGGGHDEREQTLNQILVEMDGFEQGTNVIVMAATNRPDVLDPALLRPGRFDRRITLDAPDMKAREEILEVHTKNKPLEAEVKLREIARKTPGVSGADLANIANEAAILAARQNRKKVSQADLHEAVEKVALGPERKSHILNDEEKKITAYHEAGHALLSHLLAHCHSVHKVSIVSRGMAGGVTWSLPEEDKHLHSVADFKDDIAMSLGGRTAEKIVFNEITTGAESDLKHANELARRMVTEYGMTDSLKNRFFGEVDNSIFLGRTMGEGRQYSEEIASKIDNEVAKIIDEGSQRASEVITKNRQQLDLIAKTLIEKETLEGPEFEKLFASLDKKAPPKDIDTALGPHQEV
ncbi:ATP-dependent metallopeptidase FtsH/Yme1/Tma family protein [Candidatus Saccharibacteria bacterium]|nr:ATP-dependent metallopeptidase FtsH/Yme1/Tma family protein [Candidatus Saccharibacteria bacterium]